MKLDRSKNTAKGFFFGSINRIYGMLLPFITRTVIIYTLGMEYVGLNSLFASVLQVLNLAELGVGAALNFSMYEPLANDDNKKVCALMNLYKNYYRIIGLIILIIGIGLVPFLPKLITGEIPDNVNLYILYFLNLGTTVITYWLFSYKNCLIAVHQRNDISSKIAISIDTAKTILQIVSLVAFKNYYYYLIVGLLFGIISNIVTAIIVDKKYPHLRARGKLSKEETSGINKRVKDLFISKIGTTIVSSSDALVISSFLGLTMLAKYQNYYSILGMVFGFAAIFATSAIAGVGNSLITESEEKNFADLNKISFIYTWFGVFAISCLACLYQPFMTIWVGKDNLLPYGMVVLLCIFFFIKQVTTVLNLYKDAAGIWHQDRFRPLITGILNIVMNLIMVQFWGIYGILLSTVLSSLIVEIPWLIINVFTNIFHFSPKRYLSKLAIYAILTAVLTACCFYITSFVNFEITFLTFIVRLVICTVFVNSFMFIIFRKTTEFRYLVTILNKFTKGKIKLINKMAKRND